MFPDVDPDVARRFILQCSDLTLVLTADRVVNGAYPSEDMADISFEAWLGQPIADLATSDSRPKIEHLLKDDALSDDADSRWRHLNFDLPGGGYLPLLMKCFRVSQDADAHHVLCCRDLRAIEGIVNQFEVEILNLTKEKLSSSQPN